MKLKLKKDPKNKLYMKRSAFDLLKVGVGPSSSHTMGPMKMALDFRKFCLKKKFEPVEIRITLKGSLAHTGEGHLTPNAIIGGLLGYDPVKTPISQLQQATSKVVLEQGFFIGKHWISTQERDFIHFDRQSNDLPHPNTACFEILDASGASIASSTYCSIGGGEIVQVEKLIERIKEDEIPDSEKISLVEILRQCEETQMSLLNWAYEQEELISGLKRDDIKKKLVDLFGVMRESVDVGLNAEGQLPGKLRVRRRAKKAWERFLNRSTPLQLSVPAMGQAGIYALSVSEQNASGGRVVTAPTCGACGVVPGVLNMFFKDLKQEEETVAEALLICALIGNIVVDRASISGAEVGCQGEVGVACAMAAGAACALSGGTNAQIEEAAEAALEHHLGLTCDPIFGLVQVPCIERNAIAAGTALNSANLSLMGEGHHLVSFDKCVDTMMATGADMSEKYKETALGGLATTHC